MLVLFFPLMNRVEFSENHDFQPPRENTLLLLMECPGSLPRCLLHRQRSSQFFFQKELQTSFCRSFISFTAFESIDILLRAEAQLSSELLKSQFMFGFSNSRVMPDSFLSGGRNNIMSKQTCGCKALLECTKTAKSPQ